MFKKVFNRTFLVLALAVLACVNVIGAIPIKVSAATGAEGETYSWERDVNNKDKIYIRMAGGKVWNVGSSTDVVMFTGNDGGKPAGAGLQLDGTLYRLLRRSPKYNLPVYCGLNTRIISNVGSTSVKLEKLGNGDPDPGRKLAVCDSDITGRYWGKTFDTSNAYPTSGGLQQAAVLDIRSPKKASDSPNQINVSVIDASGAVVASGSVNKTTLDANSAYYEYTTRLPAGNYKVCVNDSSIIDCSKYNVGDYGSHPECASGHSGKSKDPACLLFEMQGPGSGSNNMNFGTYLSDTITPTPPNSPGVGDNIDTSPTCDSSPLWKNPLAWVMCAIFNLFAKFIDMMLTTFIQPLLATNPIDLDSSKPMYKIWSGFRIYGDIVLVVALLVMVISQAFGGGVVEAYTTRRALPRLLIAAILINLSIYIVAFAVDLSNIIGYSVGSVITAPLQSAQEFKITPHGIELWAGPGGAAGIVAGFLGGFITAGSLGAVGVFLLVFVALPALIAVLSGFVTIIILHAVIYALIITSSVAFGLYALPNTEKYFKIWWSWLFRALLVFPIIAVLFAISDVMSVLIMQANGIPTGAGDPPLLGAKDLAVQKAGAALLSFFVMFLPLCAIPFAFKLSGGLMGKISEFTGSYGKRITEAIKGNPNDMNSLRNRTRRRLLEGVNVGRAKLMIAGQRMNEDGTPAAGFIARFRGRRAGGRVANVMGGDAMLHLAKIQAEAKKINDQKSATGDDSERYAGASYLVRKGHRGPERDANGVHKVVQKDTWFNAKGKPIWAGLAKRGQRLNGRTNADIAENVGYSLGKAQTDEERDAARFAFGAVAQDRKWSQPEITMYWKQASYDKKGIDVTDYFSSPTLVNDPSGGESYVKFLDVGDAENTQQYGNMLDFMHKAGQPHLQAQERDAGFRAMFHQQRNMEGRLEDLKQQRDSGSVLTQDEQKEYDTKLSLLAKTYEEFDAATYTMDTMVDDGKGGKVSAGGFTAASKPLIEAAVANRKFALGDYDPATGKRTVYGTQDKMVPTVYGDRKKKVANTAVVYGEAQTTGNIGRSDVVREVKR